ncbi:uncharacterized protein LOC144367597 [Ictidomys tridecemlineatus]
MGQVEWAAWLDRDKPHNRFNDGKVDPAGRFVAGGLLKGLAQATWRTSRHGGCWLGGDLRSPPQAAGKRPPGAMQALGSPQVPSHSKSHGFQVILPGSLPREDLGRVEAARVGQQPELLARGHSRAAEGPAPLPEQASSQWNISGVPPSPSTEAHLQMPPEGHPACCPPTEGDHSSLHSGSVWDGQGRVLPTDLPLSPGTMPEASGPGVWEPGQGSLYTLFADHSVVRQLDQLGIPNGLDHRTLYQVDSLDYSVRDSDYDLQTGGLANPRLVCQLEPEQGMPDGLCVDTTGTLWVACIDGGRVIRMDPETGTRLCTLKMPVSRVMSCCFRGADYSDLYVTSAADSLSPEQLLWEPQAGHVFKVSGVSLPGSAWLPATSSRPGIMHLDLGNWSGLGSIHGDICPPGTQPSRGPTCPAVHRDIYRRFRKLRPCLRMKL